jgi:hypothetical protein
MALIQATDFDSLPYKIPNQSEFPSFVAFIEAKEEEILKQLLGYDLYTEFMAEVETSGVPDQKWLDLRDGSTYVLLGKKYEYKGLIDLLKPAIYSQWISVIQRKLTSVGVVVNDGQQNTTQVNPSYEIVTNWNLYVRKVTGVINSFYGWMKDNEDDFPTWEYTSPNYINDFGI